MSAMLCTIITSISLFPLISFDISTSQILSGNHSLIQILIQILLLGVKVCLYIVLTFALNSVFNILMTFLLLLFALFLIGITAIMIEYKYLRFEFCNEKQDPKSNSSSEKQNIEVYQSSDKQELEFNKV